MTHHFEQGKGIGRYMVVRTVQALKAEQIGNICLFADAEGVPRAPAHLRWRFCPDNLECSNSSCVYLQLLASTNSWGSKLTLTECEECSGISADDMLYNDKSINLYH